MSLHSLRSVFALSASLLLVGPTLAQEAAQPSASETDGTPAAANEAASDAAEKDDQQAAREAAALYTPPQKSDAATISAWVEKVSQTPAPDRTPAGLREHFRKLEQAADLLLQREIEEDALVQVIRLKAGANSLLTQLGDTEAAQRRTQFIESLKQDSRPGVAVHGRLLGVEQATDALQPNDEAAAQKLIDQVVALLQERPLTDAHVSVAYNVAETIESHAGDKFATTAYQMFAKYLKQGTDPRYAAVAETFEGAARRLNLVGNPVKISGKTLEGETFDIDQWKGKVVLVDFWATWCGPCLEEMPNIKTLYDKHHEAGFEVVGINMDDNLGRVGAFVRTQGLEWPHLVSESGQDHPLANYYGVYQIPTTFVVGRDGKVAAVDVYGDDLKQEVERLMNVKQ